MRPYLRHEPGQATARLVLPVSDIAVPIDQVTALRLIQQLAEFAADSSLRLPIKEFTHDQ